MHGVRLADVADPGLGQAEETDLSFAYQLAHRAGHHFYGHFSVDAVLIKQIDVIGA